MKPVFFHIGLLLFAVLPLAGADSPAVFYLTSKPHKANMSEQEQRQKRAVTVDAIQWAAITENAKIDTEDNGWVSLSSEAWEDEQSAPIMQTFVCQMLFVKQSWTETERVILQSALTAFVEVARRKEVSSFRGQLQAFYQQAFMADSLEQLAQNRMICVLLHPMLEGDERMDQFGISPLAKKFSRREAYLKTRMSTISETNEKSEIKNDF